MQPIEPKTFALITAKEIVEAAPIKAAASIRLGNRPPGFDEKAKLLARAIVILLLLQKVQKNPASGPVLKEFERTFLPPTMEEGQGMFTTLRAEMAAFNRLITERKELRWSAEWLAAAGIERTDPASLAQFAQGWMVFYVETAKAIDKYQPADAAKN